LYVIGKTNPERLATVNNFVRILFEAVRRLPREQQKNAS
jgi:hypothetical protein